jgi:hypothetical protein
VNTTNTHPTGRWIERRAKLFEAGDYPDKGVTVTPEHLRALASGFSRPVPLLIEHAESPLEMGCLKEVSCEGHELFGTVALTPEADSLVERSGARSLSLGLAPDLSSIREVSLVRNPRVQSARLFGGEVTFVGSVEPSDLASEWRRLDEAKAEREVDDLLRKGRLVPAQARFAKALLLSRDTIEFDGRSQPLRGLVLALLERQPKLNLFAELTPAPQSDHSQHLMLPEEADFYRRHFPEVSLDEIAKRRFA